ncbi:MAG: OmpH family outer membrane protein [Polyangiales bacterium]
MKARIFPLLAAAALAISVPVFHYAEAQTKPSKVKARVATVDVERCVGETEDGLRAKAALAKAKDRKQQLIFAMEDELRILEQKLQQMVAAMQASGATQPSEEVRTMALKYQRMSQEYQVFVKSSERELQILEDKLFRPVEDKVLGIFKCIAQAEGYDLLVDKKSMPITMKPDLDLTERVIKQYNWNTPCGGASATPSASASAAPSASAKKPAPPPPAL